MEENQQQFLQCLRGALFRREAVRWPEGEAERDALLALAGEQHVLPLVLDRLIPAARAAGVDQGALRPLRQLLIQSAVGQTRRTGKLVELCGALEAEGLRPLLVKGLACRLLYPNPDLRPSSDEDLLARDGEMEAIHGVLTRMGMEAEEGGPPGQAQVVTYCDQESGLRIELHRRLFAEDAQAYGGMNRCFARAFERGVLLEGAGGPVWTMGPDDHLLYLICHSFKHFLHSGFGVRQVCDICLAAAAWGDRIAWDALFDALKPFRADCFARNLFAIGAEYLGFAGLWPEPMAAALAARGETDCLPLLEDLLTAGVYGSSSDVRLHSSRITLNAVAAEGEQRLGRSVLRTVFPSARELEGRYPYLKDKPWLLPGAWVQRLARYAGENRGRAGAARESVAIGERRVALLKKYGVIP